MVFLLLEDINAVRKITLKCFFEERMYRLGEIEE
jgi:hypothetical protein